MSGYRAEVIATSHGSFLATAGLSCTLHGSWEESSAAIQLQVNVLFVSSQADLHLIETACYCCCCCCVCCLATTTMMMMMVMLIINAAHGHISVGCCDEWWHYGICIGVVLKLRFCRRSNMPHICVLSVRLFRTGFSLENKAAWIKR